ncbi:hepatocyte growth factor-regulated tyrosine kinase substrate-like [Hibiscus syriacus]|uniref:Hepatocyte growth factor-regulated tyrosine kinase substrate-like n=1 Tax=Hibiscus syriacus TaxID=106335 RepID=A0A6A2YDJ9_HIBSY|nr:hepatocyte growth factor-regulated tyrosine kinase substrate-like [Hibiscus syriacus]
MPLNGLKYVQEISADIAVEALGKPQKFLQYRQSVRDGGKAVMIGLTRAGAVGEVDINRLVRRKVKVIGSYGAWARQDLPKLVKLAETGVFNPSSAAS